MPLKNDQVLPLDYIQAEAGFHRSNWHVVVPRKFSFADTQNPEWWKHQTRIKEADLVDLIGEAGDFDVTCRVVSADKGFVILRVLREWHAVNEAQQRHATGEPYVALMPNHGWTLFGADGSPISRYGDEDGARKALAELPPLPASAAVEAAA